MAVSGMDYRKLRAKIALQYGIELDETSLAILVILTQELKRQFVKMDQAQEEMAAQIQLSKKALQVDTNHPRWQAFWHGMGQWGLGICLAVMAVMIIFSIDLGKQRQEKEQLQQELALYKTYYQENTKASPKAATTGRTKSDVKQKNK